MGGEESKSCRTKHNASKKTIAKLLKQGLRQEEIDHVLELLRSERNISTTVLRNLWSHLLSSKLMDLYENYLLNHSVKMHDTKTVDEITFCVFLSNFVKGTVEDRADLYSEFFRMKDGSILIENIIEYTGELMKSVFRIMLAKNVDQYTQWSKRGTDFTDDAMRRWTSATIRNVCDPNEVVSISREKLISWVTVNTDVMWLQSYLFYSLYEMEKLETLESGEQKAMQCPLPYLEYDDSREDWRAIVDIPSVLFINSHLPAENRYQWRLAYSTAIHGEGFTRLCSLICHRGPTILVIRDKDNHVFGGYASTSWHLGPQFFGDERCFLFTLQPVMKIHPALPRHNDHFLYLNTNQKTLPNGLGMGGQPDYWGLWIDASFEFGKCSPSCSTYGEYKMLSGSPTFAVAELEVWCAERNPKDIVDEGDDDSDADSTKKAEEQSILNKDPTGRVLLDMISKDRAVRDYLDNA